jgi:hypothetical protein
VNTTVLVGQWNFPVCNRNVSIANRNIAVRNLDIAFKMDEFCYRGTECSGR